MLGSIIVFYCIVFIMVHFTSVMCQEHNRVMQHLSQLRQNQNQKLRLCLQNSDYAYDAGLPRQALRR
jgi:hypothetical protein